MLARLGKTRESMGGRARDAWDACAFFYAAAELADLSPDEERLSENDLNVAEQRLLNAVNSIRGTLPEGLPVTDVSKEAYVELLREYENSLTGSRPVTSGIISAVLVALVYTTDRLGRHDDADDFMKRITERINSNQQVKCLL